jgi:hypothetical protein
MIRVIHSLNVNVKMKLAPELHKLLTTVLIFTVIFANISVPDDNVLIYIYTSIVSGSSYIVSARGSR